MKVRSWIMLFKGRQQVMWNGTKTPFVFDNIRKCPDQLQQESHISVAVWTTFGFDRPCTLRGNASIRVNEELNKYVGPLRRPLFLVIECDIVVTRFREHCYLLLRGYIFIFSSTKTLLISLKIPSDRASLVSKSFSSGEWSRGDASRWCAIVQRQKFNKTK
jgi:hypothetical protein